MTENKFTVSLYLLNAVAWLATACLWYSLWYFNPYTSRIEIPGPTVVLFGVSLFALYFCYKRQPRILMALSTISVFPFGIYLLATPGIFAVIGLTNILSLGVACAIWATSDGEAVQNGN